MSKLLNRVFVIFAFLSCTTVWAAPVENTPVEDPYQAMQTVVDTTFPQLQKLRKDDQLTPEVAQKIITEKVMPYIDYHYAAYMVMGRSLPKTTREQRDRFVAAFYHYLVTTYSNALSQYDEQTITIEKPRPYDGLRVMTVPAEINETGRPPIHLLFKFRRLKNNKWLAFDLIAEGVSLLATNQSEVGGLIQNKGIDEVSKMLETRQIKAAPLNDKKQSS
ncbi:phospholipid-binding protein MlaC [Celerinatantimonas sp. YJH-8]|uniref:MlaC/ttg2D family ABC transporter substrate-binding protein n=1 Tax=Celerinatantimonas sp. YJH-8 TaxID=3228714 RepID=UPI0038C4618C